MTSLACLRKACWSTRVHGGISEPESYWSSLAWLPLGQPLWRQAVSPLCRLSLCSRPVKMGLGAALTPARTRSSGSLVLLVVRGAPCALALAPVGATLFALQALGLEAT